MKRPRLLFTAGGHLLAVPVEDVIRVREAGPTTPLPGAHTAVHGLAACFGRVHLVLDSDVLLASSSGSVTVHDRPPLWVLLGGAGEGLILEVRSPVTFAAAGAPAPRPEGTRWLCHRGEVHAEGTAGLLSDRRLRAAVRRAAGPLSGLAPSPESAR
jgi:hypothetical protein